MLREPGYDVKADGHPPLGHEEGTKTSPGHPAETAPDTPGVVHPYDVYCEACPTRRVLDRLADKWVVLILGRLALRPMRFNQLRRDIQGVLQTVLSQMLKKLERDWLVLRRAFATVPVTVEYSIAPLGETLATRIADIARWAEQHIEAVEAAQRRYDAAAG